MSEPTASPVTPLSESLPGRSPAASPDARRAKWLARLQRIRARQVAHNYSPEWEPEDICQLLLEDND